MKLLSLPPQYEKYSLNENLKNILSIRLRIIKVTTTQTQTANMRSFYKTNRFWNQTKTSHPKVTWIALFWSVKTKAYPFLSFFSKYNETTFQKTNFARKWKKVHTKNFALLTASENSKHTEVARSIDTKWYLHFWKCSVLKL